jgi:hypothetical protein
MNKKEWLLPQMPSIRKRSHSYLGSITKYGDYNGKETLLFSINLCQEKNATLW